MTNIVKTVAIAALAGVVGLSAAGAATAAPWPYYQHQYYYAGPGYYSDQGYYPRYSYHHDYYRYDPGAAIIGGIFGGIFGALAGAAVHSGGSHVWRCEHTYRSYQPSINTYMGYDGQRHACML